MGFGALVKSVVVMAENDAAKVKAAILKAVQEVDNVVLPEADKLEPIIAQVASAIVPGGGPIVDLAYHWLEISAKALDAGGAAVESNLANAGLDTAAIAAIKALIPQLKAAAEAAKAAKGA